MSMSSTVSKTVGGTKFVIHKLPASKAVRVHLALGKVILDAIAGGAIKNVTGLVAGQGAAGKDGEAATASAAEQEQVIGVLLRLFTALPADDWTTPDGRRNMGFDSLARLLLEHVKIAAGHEALDVDMDANFNNVGDLYLVLWEVLVHNFRDFLGDVLSRSAQLKAKAA